MTTKYKIAIYAPIKDEILLKEWIEYYNKLKISLFVIMDDFSEIPVENYFKELNIKNYKIFRQNESSWDYNLCKRKIGLYFREKSINDNLLPICNEYNIDYVLQIDADEFLYLNKFNNLDEMIDYYKPFDELRINWLLFNHSNIKCNNSNSLINTFILSQEYVNSYSKSLVKVSSIITGYNAHHFTLKQPQLSKNIFNDKIDGTINNCHSKFYCNNYNQLHYTNCPIFIAHYVYKAINNFVEKKCCVCDGNFDSIFNISDLETKKKIIDFNKNNKEIVIDYIYELQQTNIDEKKISNIETCLPFIKELKHKYLQYYKIYDVKIIGKKKRDHIFEYKENVLIRQFYNNNVNIIKFYNLDTIPNNIIFPDIYFTPEYGRACEYSDDAIWECCIYKDLMYVYLKRPYTFENNIYYDLITPYGYSGYYFHNQETFDEFIHLFRKEALNKNYLTEVVRQSPYANNTTLNNYDIVLSKKTYGIDLTKYSIDIEYLNNTSKNNKRMIDKAIKNNLKFKLESYDYNNKQLLNCFISIYNETMNNLEASEYFFFNDDYFNKLNNHKNNIKIANVYKDDILIASSIIFVYNNYINYHLGGSKLEYRKYGPNNFLHYNVVIYGIENNKKLYHLGGGLKENDSLSKFKEHLSNINFNYTIYKNIFNNDVYELINNDIDKNNIYFPLHRK